MAARLATGSPSHGGQRSAPRPGASAGASPAPNARGSRRARSSGAWRRRRRARSGLGLLEARGTRGDLAVRIVPSWRAGSCARGVQARKDGGGTGSVRRRRRGPRRLMIRKPSSNRRQDCTAAGADGPQLRLHDLSGTGSTRAGNRPGAAGGFADLRFASRSIPMIGCVRLIADHGERRDGCSLLVAPPRRADSSGNRARAEQREVRSGLLDLVAVS